jgi:hypothetical protein
MIEDFSSGYYIVDADVVPYGGERVAAADDFFEVLKNKAPYPLLKLDNEHYMVHPQHGIPSETVAVPDYVSAEDAEPVLLAKDGETLREMLMEESL